MLSQEVGANYNEWGNKDGEAAILKVLARVMGWWGGRGRKEANCWFDVLFRPKISIPYSILGHPKISVPFPFLKRFLKPIVNNALVNCEMKEETSPTRGYFKGIKGKS